MAEEILFHHDEAASGKATSLKEGLELLKFEMHRTIALGARMPAELVDPVRRVLTEGGFEAGAHVAAHDLVCGELADFERDKATWPASTDCDRLEAAFCLLESRGILARYQDDCYYMDNAALWRELYARLSSNAPARGFVFYDWDEACRAWLENEMDLYFEPATQNEDARREIGDEIVAVLRDHGFEPYRRKGPMASINIGITWQQRSAKLPSAV